MDMDKPLSVREVLLPDAWSKMIFGVTIVLSGALYKFYPDLPTKWLPASEVDRFLWRLIVTGICTLLGSVSLITSQTFTFHKYKKDLLTAQSESQQKSNTIQQMKQATENIKQNVLGMSSVHDAQTKQVEALLAQRNKLAQIFKEDIRLTEERLHFLTSLEPHLKTPQVLEEIKYISLKAQNFKRFSEMLLDSDTPQ